ncbi:MAG TPA: PepSY domain-containing protein [Thermodesulfobacteriota bacterium]|nr:PepSY domain-containing protein [Thermodesulfobacteriota bacterium]
MQTAKSILVGAIAFCALGASLALAKGGGEGDNIAALLSKTGIGMAKAVSAAEDRAQGKAVRAELEDENGTPVYGVEVMSGTKLTDVKVDVKDGKILSAQADEADHEGREKEREGGENED